MKALDGGNKLVDRRQRGEWCWGLKKGEEKKNKKKKRNNGE
jgi:hypothetical protein